MADAEEAAAVEEAADAAEALGATAVVLSAKENACPAAATVRLRRAKMRAQIRTMPRTNKQMSVVRRLLVPFETFRRVYKPLTGNLKSPPLKPQVCAKPLIWQ